MIISKTPFRIPLTGGGTDLDFYYKKKGGQLYSLAINQHVYVLIHRREIDKNYLIQTTKTEFSEKINNINHDLIRETLRFFNLKEKLHVSTFSTIPTNTGLGSSSSMIIGLINCIKKLKNMKINDLNTIKIAYEIERKICKNYGGWQDQVISQYGGLIKLDISKNEKINIKKILIDKNIINKVQKNFILVYSKKKRSSSAVANSVKNRKIKIIDDYDKIKSLNETLILSMTNKNPKYIADIFNKHWIIKKRLSKKITNIKINQFYNQLMKKYNFLGGKLIGAGGGGFFLMVTKNKKQSISMLNKDKISYIDFEIEKLGSRIILG